MTVDVFDWLSVAPIKSAYFFTAAALAVTWFGISFGDLIVSSLSGHASFYSYLSAMSWIAFGAWTVPRTWVAAETVTAALMNTHIRDNELALQAGLVGTGFVELDLLGTASAPSVSSASHATLYYDTAQQAILASLNAGAYAAIGTPLFQNALLISRWSEIARR